MAFPECSSTHLRRTVDDLELQLHLGQDGFLGRFVTKQNQEMPLAPTHIPREHQDDSIRVLIKTPPLCVFYKEGLALVADDLV